ncbi:MAG: hypothetical protein WBB37_01215 [bacterium]
MKKITILLTIIIVFIFADQIAVNYKEEFVILHDNGTWSDLYYNDEAEIYVCKGWVDENYDDLVTKDELVGIKDTWYEGHGDTLYIFGHWYDKEGQEAEFYLGTLGGRDMWEYDPSDIRTDNHWVWRWFDVDELAEYGLGEWDAFWITDDMDFVWITFEVK